jgi:hypothetical protein
MLLRTGHAIGQGRQKHIYLRFVKQTNELLCWLMNRYPGFEIRCLADYVTSFFGGL